MWIVATYFRRIAAFLFQLVRYRRLCLFLSFWGLLVLLPTYATIDTPLQRWDKYTILNAAAGDNTSRYRLWVASLSGVYNSCDVVVKPCQYQNLDWRLMSDVLRLMSGYRIITQATFFPRISANCSTPNTTISRICGYPFSWRYCWTQCLRNYDSLPMLM